MTFLQSDTDFIARSHGSATGKMVGRYYGQVLISIYTAFSALCEDDGINLGCFTTTIIQINNHNAG